MAVGAWRVGGDAGFGGGDFVGRGNVEDVDGERDAGVADADLCLSWEDEEQGLVFRERAVEAEAFLAFVLRFGDRDL